MKKHTPYLVIAFLMGIILTQYLLDKRQVTEKVKQSQVEATTEESTPAVAVELKKNQMPSTNSPAKAKESYAKEMIVAPTPEVTSQKTQPTEIKSPQKKVFGLTLDEVHIAKLERNINALSVMVEMKRESRGWRVNYLTNDNPMASVGLQNNDLVLYEMMSSASQQGPEQHKLISRLENIFSTLEH